MYFETFKCAPDHVAGSVTKALINTIFIENFQMLPWYKAPAVQFVDRFVSKY